MSFALLIMRKPLLGIVLLAFVGLAFADMISSLASVPGSFHNSVVLIAPVMAILALFAALYLRNRTLTIRFLAASVILLVLLSTSCIWLSYLAQIFVQAGIGMWGCRSVNCQQICQAIALEKANADKTDPIIWLEWISLVFIGLGFVGYLYKKGKNLGRSILEAVVQLLFVGVLLILVFFLGIIGSYGFSQILAPFFLLVITLMVIGAIFITNDAKKPELQRDKYTVASAAAVLIGLAILVYVIYLMNSPGFAFQCQELVGYAEGYGYYCCQC